MLRIIVCGAQKSDNRAIIESLSGEGFDVREVGAGLSALAEAASTADVAVLAINENLPGDGIHGQLLALSVLGVGRVALAFNSMDLVETSQAAYDVLCRDYGDHAAALGLEIVAAASLSAEGAPGAFRFAVMLADGDAVSGTMAGGSVRTGDAVVVLPGAKTGTIASIAGESGPAQRHRRCRGSPRGISSRRHERGAEDPRG